MWNLKTWTLLPITALWQVALAFKSGLDNKPKYTRNGWMNKKISAVTISENLESMRRHSSHSGLFSVDSDSGLMHEAHVAARAIMSIWYKLKLQKELDKK